MVQKITARERGEPMWLRWPVVLPVGAVYAVFVAHAAAQLGMWVVLVGLGGLAVPAAVFAQLANVRQQRALRRFLESRPPLAVDVQVHQLLAREGIAGTPENIEAVAAAWLEAARLMRVDPERLRCEDDIWQTYRPVRPHMAETPAFFEEFEDRIEDRAAEADAYCADGPCPVCGYSEEHLPRERRCPECGTRIVGEIRTLGAYVLFVSGAGRARPEVRV